MDYTTAYVFGTQASSNMLSQLGLARTMVQAWKTRTNHVFLPQELPVLTRWMRRLGLTPRLFPSLGKSLRTWDHEEWVLSIQDRAEEVIQQTNDRETKG